MRYLLLLFFLFATFHVSAQELQDLWSKNIDNPYNEYASEMAIDHVGNIWALANADGPIGNLTYRGNDEAYLIKMDSDGNKLWDLSFGGTADDHAYNLAIDAQNNCWVSGFFSDTLWIGDSSLISHGGTDAFLLKFAPNGVLKLAKQLGSTGYDRAHQVVIQENHVFWTGVYQGTIDLGIDTLTEIAVNDVFLLKMDTLGQAIWVKQWGGPTVENIAGLTVDIQGNVTAASLFRDAVIIESDTLWGVPTINNFLVQYASNGTLLWKTAFEGTGSSLSNGNNGNIYYTGYYTNTINILGQQLTPLGETDGFVLSLDNNGQLRWLNPIQGMDKISTTNVFYNPQRQEIYASGPMQGTLYYGNDSLKTSGNARHVDDDVYVMVYDVNGLPLNAQKFGGEYEDWIANFALHPTNGSIYMYGSFENNIDFVTTTLLNTGNRDLFIAKFIVQTVAVKQIECTFSSPITLYPNPVQHQAKLSFALSNASDISIQLFNMQGQLLKTVFKGQLNKGQQEVDLLMDNKLMEGVYFLHIQTPKETLSRKFIKVN